jgi:hypothetical protein
MPAIDGVAVCELLVVPRPGMPPERTRTSDLRLADQGTHYIFWTRVPGNPLGVFHADCALMSNTSAAGRKNRIMIYGPEPDGTYVIEFRTAAG